MSSWRCAVILNEPAAQKEAFNLASLLTNVNPYNLIKPDVDTAAPGVPLPVREALTLNKKMVSRAQEKLLKGYGFIWYDHLAEKSCYSPSVAAKSATGRGNPNTLRATQTPKASFFVSVHYAHQISGLVRTVSMVALVGLRSRRPVSFVSGISTPANVTAISERGNSGGDSLNTKEAATCWLLPLPKNRNLSGLSPQFAAIARQLPPKFIILLPSLNAMLAVLWCAITSAFLPDVFAQGAHMLNYFRVAGCATARSGELVEFVYIVDARSAISAKAEALNQARNERLSHIQITRIREVAA